MDKSSNVFETEENGVGKCPDCTVEVGTVFDGEDCTVDILQSYETEQLAKEAEVLYTAKAREVESEPCQIKSSITPVDSAFQLKMELVFSCQSEKVIFQLRLR
ncbi:YfcZ/YiiS family protein [Neisseria perflava]|uniref:YfcZ/YiiS family protein n=1 Tax=Neisseria perflava TaxID=33053 RepID=UPI00209E9FAB|nr:YfcZ/YiiS family protein [Neisseria perflava]MCP1660318.1 uncharacterized protein (TIGR00743 family) [Neisseria perflava]MCP1771519.1 uncharacterized protein (TIGR00743 family) [Neisseria perflava]